jgi:hypothetical protein
MVATVVTLELQVTEVEMFWVLPSLYVPVAVNWRVKPSARGGFVGETAIDWSAGFVAPAAATTVGELCACKATAHGSLIGTARTSIASIGKLQRNVRFF